LSRKGESKPWNSASTVTSYSASRKALRKVILSLSVTDSLEIQMMERQIGDMRMLKEMREERGFYKEDI
jgi:hypothetical protein